MAKVNIDFIPTISDIVSDDAGITKLIEKLNTSFSRLNEIIRILGTAINTVEFGNGSMEENILCNWIPVEFGTAGTELSAAHTLRKVPTAIVGSKLASAGTIYFSKDPTTSNIYLKSDTNSMSGTIIII